jgi:hypothetical protein
MADRNRIPTPHGMGELWVGGYPHPIDDMNYFDLIVSAVQRDEWHNTNHNVPVIRVPLSDHDEELNNVRLAGTVRTAATQVAHALSSSRGARSRISS